MKMLFRQPFVICLTLLLTALMSSTSHALVWAPYKNVGPAHYITVILYNNTTGPAGANSAVMVSVNMNSLRSGTQSIYKSDLSNVNWQDGHGNILKSWLEYDGLKDSKPTYYWINLGPNTIPAGGRLTIYQVVYATNMSAMDGVDTGAEPNYIPNSYGRYDNGAQVFTFYDNFAGTAINTANWTTNISISGGAISVNNGLTLTSRGGTSASEASINFVKAQSTSDIVIEAFMNYFGSIGTNVRARVNHGLALSATPTVSDFGYFSGMDNFATNTVYLAWVPNLLNSVAALPLPTSTTDYNTIDRQTMIANGGKFTWTPLNPVSYQPLATRSAAFTGSTFSQGYAATNDANSFGSTTQLNIKLVRIRPFSSLPTPAESTVSSPTQIIYRGFLPRL